MTWLSPWPCASNAKQTLRPRRWTAPSGWCTAAHHKATPPPAKAEKKPIVHTITSELTGEKSSFVQLEDPAPYEENLSPRDVAPSTRALADLALVLLNSNEFVYVY
jgi:hypothetical protein